MDNKKLQKLTNNLIMFPMYHKKLIQGNNGHKECSLATPLNPKIKILGTILFNGPMHMSEISDKLCVTKPHITTLIDDLINEGLVKREYNTKDRRVIKINLTKKGKQYLKNSRDETQETIKEKMLELSDKDFNTLVNASEDMMRILSKLHKEYDIHKAIAKLKTVK